MSFTRILVSGVLVMIIVAGAAPVGTSSSVVETPGDLFGTATCTAIPDDAGSGADAPDNFTEAVALGDGEWEGCFGLADDSDWYTFPLRALEVVDVTVWSYDDVELYVQLEACGGDYFDADYDENPLQVVAAPYEPGTACLVVERSGSAGLEDASYQLLLRRDAHRCGTLVEGGPQLFDGYNFGCVDAFDGFDPWNGTVVAGERNVLQFIGFGEDCEGLRVYIQGPDGTVAVLRGGLGCQLGPVAFTSAQTGDLYVDVSNHRLGTEYYLSFFRGPLPDLAISAVREVRQNIRTDVATVPNPADEHRVIEVDVTNVGERRAAFADVEIGVRSDDCATAMELVTGSCDFEGHHEYFEIQDGVDPGEVVTLRLDWAVLTELGDHRVDVAVYGIQPEPSLENNVATFETFVRVGGLGGVT